MLSDHLGDVLAAFGLAGQIVELLFNTPKDRDALSIELLSIQNTLILTDKAFRCYSPTPLNETVARFIQPDVAQCHLCLAQFFDKINTSGKALSATTIPFLWPRVVRASDDTVALTAKLSNHRLRIAVLLNFLNSDRLPHLLGVRFSDIPTHLHSIINSFSSILRIKDNTIDVVDHLEDTVPVLTLFCTTWESFNNVVMYCCSNPIGQSYIERGDCQMMRPDSDQAIHPEDFARMVEERETVEISVIVRPPSIEQDERRCPKCRRLNTYAASYGGWITCIGCDGIFRCARQVKTTQRSQKHTVFNGKPYPRRLANTKVFRRITLKVEFDEYDAEVKIYMQQMERLTMPSLEQLDQETRFNWSVREDLIDFMLLIHESLDLRPETLYLAVNIMDRYLSLCAVPVPIENYRMLAGTALWIAAKKEDIFVPILREVVNACMQRYDTASNFRCLESDILHTIQWMLEHPTAFLWFSMLPRYLWDSTEVKHVGWFLMELTLYNREFIQYKSSAIASGSLIVARTLLDPAYQRRSARQEPLEVATTLERYLERRWNDLPMRLVEKYSYPSYSNASELVMQYYSQTSQPAIH